MPDKHAHSVLLCNNNPRDLPDAFFSHPSHLVWPQIVFVISTHLLSNAVGMFDQGRLVPEYCIFVSENPHFRILAFSQMMVSKHGMRWLACV